MKNRIKDIRHQHNLSQEAFGKKINLSKPSISALERGERDVTDRTVADICRVFGVNEEWLRHGTGEMFLPVNDEENFERIWRQIKLSKTDNAEFIKKIMRSYWSLSDDKQAVIKELIEGLSEK